ncbi:MAG: hypothetical protein EXR91_02075 [Gemmatimonadetes bacterium]|nr:hypothetical protein [Gemmatimonadota bacterium]
MSANPEMTDIAGIFKDEETAAAAVKTLIHEHFSACDDLSVIVSKGQEREAVPVWEPIPAERASAIGAAVGALLAGVAVAISGLTFGPFTLIEWGPLWAIFEAAFTGDSIGFALGALVSIEMLEPRADFRATHIRDGVVWVGVHSSTARAGRARDILAEAGAKYVMEREPAVGSFHFQQAA